METSSEPIFHAIKSGAEEATTRIRLPDHYPEPDLTLFNLCASRRQAQRNLQRNYSSARKTVLNRINAATRRYAKKIKLKQWDENCASADANKPGTPIWQILNVFTGKRDLHLSHATMAFRLGKSPEEAAELFAKQFCPTQAKHAKACNAVTTSSLLYPDFTFEELTSSLKKIK